MWLESGYDVRWQTKKTNKSRGSRLVSYTYRDFEHNFDTKEKVLRFIKKKKKEWERKDIWNNLDIIDHEANKTYTCRVTFEDDIDQWAEKSGFIEAVKDETES